MRLAQGQGAAEMTLARASGNATASADTTSTAEAPERQEAEVDPNAVAERVYQLMCADLRTALERRG